MNLIRIVIISATILVVGYIACIDATPRSPAFTVKNDFIRGLTLAVPIFITSTRSNAKSLVFDASGKPTISEISILDDSAFKKPLFNIPPSDLKYPEYFLGLWDVNLNYQKAEFSERVRFQDLQNDVNVGGFRKYSIAYMPDIGKNAQTTFRYIRRDGSVVEDIPFNLKGIIENQFRESQCKVSGIEYNPQRNPNRLGLEYNDSKGSGRIEIFVNSRSSSVDLSFHSFTHQRQLSNRQQRDILTEKGGYKQAVSQLICDYAIEMYLKPEDNTNRLRGTYIIYSYLQPQDALFFQSADLPVAAFTYSISMMKIDG